MEKDKISIPISFEFLLKTLFGNIVYHEFAREHKVYDWKTTILKMINAIRKSILVNLDITDDFHKNELLELCHIAEGKIKESKAKDAINVAAIENLIKIIFVLMGKIPDNYDKRVVNRLEYWKLNRYRKLIYTQTKSQKLNLILSLPNNLWYSDRFPEKLALFEKYRTYFRGDVDKFIRWFKNKYKDISAEIF